MSTSLLLDTQTFLYAAQEKGPLTKKARAALLREGNILYLSLASIWEMQIKISLGKLKLPLPLNEAIQQSVGQMGIHILAIVPEHIYLLDTLPFHHRDPFDRLLAAQALYEKLSFVGGDMVFDLYGIRRIW